MNPAEKTQLADPQIIDQYFLARGWFIDKSESGLIVEYPRGIPYGRNLPNILESYSAFQEHVLEVMEGEEFVLYTNDKFIIWHKDRALDKQPKEFIKDNHILRAAVLAATEYWEGKK